VRNVMTRAAVYYQNKFTLLSHISGRSW